MFFAFFLCIFFLTFSIFFCRFTFGSMKPWLCLNQKHISQLDFFILRAPSSVLVQQITTFLYFKTTYRRWIHENRTLFYETRNKTKFSFTAYQRQRTLYQFSTRTYLVKKTHTFFESQFSAVNTSIFAFFVSIRMHLRRNKHWLISLLLILYIQHTHTSMSPKIHHIFVLNL